MQFATLNDLKHQLNIETDAESANDDLLRDSNLELYLEAAKERIETVLNLSLVESYPEEISEEEKSKYILYNSQIKLAHLMIAADYFNNREESGTANLEIIPNGAMRILTSIRRWNA